MLAIANQARIFLYQGPVDLRRGFEGLSVLVESVFKQTPENGAYFVFLNRRRDQMKVLYWDVDGLAIWIKRLEKGCFSRSVIKKNLERKDFFMLLEGIIPERIQKRFTLS